MTLLLVSLHLFKSDSSTRKHLAFFYLSRAHEQLVSCLTRERPISSLEVKTLLEAEHENFFLCSPEFVCTYHHVARV